VERPGTRTPSTASSATRSTWARRGDIQRAICEHLAGDNEFATELQARRARLNAELGELNSEAKRLLAAFSTAGSGSKLLVERLGELEAKMDRIRLELGEVEKLPQTTLTIHDDATQVAELLAEFDGIWDRLVTRARVTQLMDLLLLAPDIQAEILDLAFPPGRQPLCERHLRQVARSLIWTEQRARWAKIAAARKAV